MAGQSAAKGAKKGRRFGRPRSERAKTACATRKKERRHAQKMRELENIHARRIGQPTPWEAAKERRAEAREGRKMQPRNELGMIIVKSKEDGSTRLRFDTAKAYKDALYSKELSNEIDEAALRRQRKMSKGKAKVSSNG